MKLQSVDQKNDENRTGNLQQLSLVCLHMETFVLISGHNACPVTDFWGWLLKHTETWTNASGVTG